MQPTLELSIYTLLRMAFIWQLVSLAIYVVGALTIAVFLYSNFKSLIKIIKVLLEPYFQPQLPQTLVDKYGKWAGKSDRERDREIKGVSIMCPYIVVGRNTRLT